MKTLILTTLIASHALLAPGGEANQAARPNIVLLMGDDHGWDETGYNGHPHLHTPVLDNMAANALRLRAIACSYGLKPKENCLKVVDIPSGDESFASDAVLDCRVGL